MERTVRVARPRDQVSPSIEAYGGVAVENGRLTLRGDDDGAFRRLVHVGPETVTLANGWKELSNAVDQHFQFSPESAALLLRFGFVPVPRTLFSNVFQAGVGDTLTIDLRSGAVTETYEYPFLIANSRQSETWRPEAFTDLLCASCERVVPQDAVLMLSAGKDSTALLLALQRLGRKDVVCVTYDADYREPEAALASAFAREMGFRHVTLSPDPRREFDAYVSFLRAAPHLTLDFALPAALVVAAACAEHGATVLDGSGNDKYMHYSPTRRERFLRALSLPSRLGGLGWGAAWLPEWGSRATYVAASTGMYANERWFPGTKLSAKLIDQLTGSARAAHSFARSLDRTLRGGHVVDAVTVAKGRYSDYSGGMEKTRIAVEHFGLGAAFPFCDRRLIDYYFNLPNPQRFDGQTLEAKLAFKRWLAQQPIKSEYFSTKASYRYNMAAMFKGNYESIIKLMNQSDNIDFTPTLRHLFASARHDYFRAQQAYLIFSLVVWADSHEFHLNGTARSPMLSAS